MLPPEERVGQQVGVAVAAGEAGQLGEARPAAALRASARLPLLSPEAGQGPQHGPEG